MSFEMTVTLGNIINILSLLVTVLIIAYRAGTFTSDIKTQIGAFTSAIERRIDRLEITITNQQQEVTKLEKVTRDDISKLQAQYDNCYVKKEIETQSNKIDGIEKQQVTLRAQLPLQLETIRKEIETLSTEVKGLRTDMAHRRKTNGEAND